MSAARPTRRLSRRALAARSTVAALATASCVALLGSPTDSASSGAHQETRAVVAVAAAIEQPTPQRTQPAPEAPSAIAEPLATAVVVADPRPGDMRVEPEADALPLDYSPSPAATTIFDVAYGPDAAHRLDIRLPAEANAPAIVYVHAGGWVGGSREFVPDLVLRYVERGYAVISIDYRLAPEHPFPGPVEDVKRAVRWLKVHGADTGAIDGDRIVLFGASAGGHLASFTAATAGRFEPTELSAAERAVDSTVAAVVSMVGPTDLIEFYGHDHPWAAGLTEAFVGCEPCEVDSLALASTRTHLHADLPPAYWAYGQQDALVGAAEQGATIADEWAAARGDGGSWLDVVEHGGHNLDESLLNIRQLDRFIHEATRADQTA